MSLIFTQYPRVDPYILCTYISTNLRKSRPMSSFADNVSRARESWISGYTTVDKKWKVKQLYHLHQLVTNCRDTFVALLAEGTIFHGFN